MHLRLIPALLLSCVALHAAPARADGLLGSQVNLTVNYPTFNQIGTVPVTATIGSGVEFPQGTIVTNGTTGLAYIVPVNVDFRADQIEGDYTAFDQTAPGSFNGYVATFTGAPTILGAFLDPASTYTPSQIAVSFTGNQVAINVASLPITPTSKFIVDLDFAPTPPSTVTPEPSSFALLGTGLLASITGLRRRLAR